VVAAREWAEHAAVELVHIVHIDDVHGAPVLVAGDLGGRDGVPPVVEAQQAVLALDVAVAHQVVLGGLVVVVDAVEPARGGKDASAVDGVDGGVPEGVHAAHAGHAPDAVHRCPSAGSWQTRGFRLGKVLAVEYLLESVAALCFVLGGGSHGGPSLVFAGSVVHFFWGGWCVWLLLRYWSLLLLQEQ